MSRLPIVLARVWGSNLSMFTHPSRPCWSNPRASTSVSRRVAVS